MKKLAAGLAVALSLTAASAQGARLAFEDDDVDFAYTVNAQGQLVAKPTGSLAIGDVLISVFEIPIYTVNGTNAIPAGQELTGVAAVQITNVTPGLPSGVGTSYEFSEYSGGLNAVLALGTDPDASVGVDGDAGGGATVAMWFNDTGSNLRLDTTFNGGNPSCQTIAACIFEASRGSLFQVDGFTGDSDEFWGSIVTAPGGTTIQTVRGTNNTTPVASFFAAQSTLFQAGYTIGGINIATGESCTNAGSGDGCVNGATLSGQIYGGQGFSASLAADGAFGHSDFQAQKLTVPEPGILALLAVGILGFVGLRRRV